MNQLVKMTVFLLFILRGGIEVPAQTIDIQKVHPLNWYVGVLNPNLQILIYYELKKSFCETNTFVAERFGLFAHIQPFCQPQHRTDRFLNVINKAKNFDSDFFPTQIIKK